VSDDASVPVSWHEGLLSGKVALVTGGSRGLGREIATAFSKAGAVTVIASRKVDSCQRSALEIQEMTGNEVIGIPAHVGYWPDCEGLLDEVFARLGRLDVLVNNAGIAPTYESLRGVSEELFDKTLAVNVKGPFRLAALAGARMVEDGGGSIINVSSVAGIRPSKQEVPYGIAKAGLQVLTIGLALEYGPTVRANTIVAGPFRTDITRGWDMAAVEVGVQRYPMQRIGRPAEIAGAALYFASDLSSFTTGGLLCVDGGMAVARQ
jgi:NAD(P)-dependent dehydrogenase (short-subunit alcohol dehydrogenase family)